MDVLIVGGGIGGLTLGVALGRRGHTVRVLERAKSLAPAGAGLALQPNAMTVLSTLGLADAVVADGCPVARAAILDDRGSALGPEMNMAALSAPFGVPVLAIHRARLHAVLRAALGESALTLDADVTAIETSGSDATVHGRDGRALRADLVVGADGLRSLARHMVVGADDPIYSGYTSWRGVTTPGAGPHLTRMSESWGAGERFGMVDIGHGEIYWFAVANAPPGEVDGVVRAELLERFGRWHEPIRTVLEATPPERIIRTDISDRRPVTCWHRGRLVLLGDAAHAMTPNLGQGACQAIEDAAVLAEALSTQPSVDDAFRCYEHRRINRANAIVIQARRLGWFSQWQHPAAVWMRNTVMRLTPASAAERQVQALWRV